MKISIRDLCSKCKQIRRKLRIFFTFTKKALTEKLIMMVDRLTVWSISWRSSILTIYVSVEAAFRRYSTWYVFLRTSPCWSLFINTLAALLPKTLRRRYFLWILQNFWDHLFYIIPMSECFYFCNMSSWNF